MSGPRIGVKGPRQSVFREIRLAGKAIHANIFRLEKGAEAVVLSLGDGIVFVIMAARAAQREAKKRGGCVLHRILQPEIAVVEIVVPSEKAGTGEYLGV